MKKKVREMLFTTICLTIRCLLALKIARATFEVLAFTDCDSTNVCAGFC